MYLTVHSRTLELKSRSLEHYYYQSRIFHSLLQTSLYVKYIGPLVIFLCRIFVHLCTVLNFHVAQIIVFKRLKNVLKILFSNCRLGMIRKKALYIARNSSFPGIKRLMDGPKVQKIGAIFTAEKVSILRVFLVRIFPHSDWIRIQSECEKIRTRKTPTTDTFDDAVIVSNN